MRLFVILKFQLHVSETSLDWERKVIKPVSWFFKWFCFSSAHITLLIIFPFEQNYLKQILCFLGFLLVSLRFIFKY